VRDVNSERERDRIKWHCRRGLLELDLLLQRFLTQTLDALNAEQVEVFRELLEYEDNDLLELLMGRAEPLDARLSGVLGLLRSA
jgi:antitoxin CptB